MKASNNKQALLDQIAADMVSDNVCPDLAKTATNLVPGEGNLSADVVFIGEAPGKNEDLTGRPFVGAAGKFLDELLDSIGLKREDVFITSIIKYRPPNNREPRQEEKDASWPYLLRQLKVIDPKLIVTLGRHSTGYFVPGLTITEAHGKLVRNGQWPVMPLFHPAAALYGGGMRQVVKDDFMKLAKALKNVKRKATK